jgi:hypothetical protein
MKKDKSHIKRDINCCCSHDSDERQLIFVDFIYAIHNQDIEIDFEKFDTRFLCKVKMSNSILIILQELSFSVFI